MIYQTTALFIIHLLNVHMYRKGKYILNGLVFIVLIIVEYIIYNN